MTQRRKDLGKPDSAMYGSPAFEKEVISNPQRSIIGHVWGAFASLSRVIRMLTEVTQQFSCPSDACMMNYFVFAVEIPEAS